MPTTSSVLLTFIFGEFLATPFWDAVMIDCVTDRIVRAVCKPKHAFAFVLKRRFPVFVAVDFVVIFYPWTDRIHAFVRDTFLGAA